MTDWRPVHVGKEGDGAEIGGLSVWQHTWRQTGSDPVQLPHPVYTRQTHRFSVYEIGPNEAPLRFAAGELSNGVYGFYIPKDDWRYHVVEVVPVPGPGKTILVAGATDLPAGAEVSVKLTMNNGSVVQTIGIKTWELPVREPPGKHDAFRLPSFEGDVAPGTLAELVKLGVE